MVETLYSYILDAQAQLTLYLVVGCGGYSNSFRLLSVLDTCKTEEDPFKNEGARVVIKRSPIICLCRCFVMLKAVMVALVT